MTGVDAIAIGGGLAGAAFALELARNGRPVVVLERSRAAILEGLRRFPLRRGARASRLSRSRHRGARRVPGRPADHGDRRPVGEPRPAVPRRRPVAACPRRGAARSRRESRGNRSPRCHRDAACSGRRPGRDRDRRRKVPRAGRGARHRQAQSPRLAAARRLGHGLQAAVQADVGGARRPRRPRPARPLSTAAMSAPAWSKTASPPSAGRSRRPASATSAATGRDNSPRLPPVRRPSAISSPVRSRSFRGRRRSPACLSAMSGARRSPTSSFRSAIRSRSFPPSPATVPRSRSPPASAPRAPCSRESPRASSRTVSRGV